MLVLIPRFLIHSILKTEYCANTQQILHHLHAIHLHALYTLPFTVLLLTFHLTLLLHCHLTLPHLHTTAILYHRLTFYYDALFVGKTPTKHTATHRNTTRLLCSSTLLFSYSLRLLLQCYLHELKSRLTSIYNSYACF